MSALWVLSLYPEAGEGGGCLSVARRVLPTGLPPNGSSVRLRRLGVSAGEDPAVCGCEPAEPARHADLPG